MRFFLSLLLLLVTLGAQAGPAVFSFHKTITAGELNTILTLEREVFMKTSAAASPYVMPKPSRAVHDVDLYTVAYDSVIPELGRQPVRVTGLLALPKHAGNKPLPLMSYQHGTVFGKYEVPSFAFQTNNPTGHAHYDGAFETRYMVALYAGNGFALMAADYLGLGGAASQPEAYFVKEASQQVSLDLLRDVKAFLNEKKIASDQLFLGGWSQGGLNTTGFLQRLEQEGIKVAAAFTASAPSDPFLALSGLMYFPRPQLDAAWVNTIFALSVFSFEHYHRQPGLAQAMVHPRYYADLKSIHERSYGSPDKLLALFQAWGKQPLLSYFKDEFKDPAVFSASAYAELLRRSETYRHYFRTPLTMYYGSHDEVVKESVGQLAQTHQRSLIGNPEQVGQSPLRAQRVLGADHRATFITAAPAALAWMRQGR